MKESPEPWTVGGRRGKEGDDEEWEPREGEGVEAGGSDEDLSSDEDNSLLTLAGYRLLPHGPTPYQPENNIVVSENEEPEICEAVEADPNLPQPLPASSEEPLPSREIHIDAEEIRAAMRNITLPPEAIPSWANEVPEALWKDYLLERASPSTRTG